MYSIDDMAEKDGFQFNYDWLSLEDYELRVLMLICVLSENSLAYCGTLNAMCEWLGISTASKNKTKIKECIENLKEQGYISIIEDKKELIIRLTPKGKNEDRVIWVRRIWVETMKLFNKDENNKKINKELSVGWVKMLKIFVYTLSVETKATMSTQRELAEELGMSRSSLSEGLKALEKCNFEGIAFKKSLVRNETKNKKGQVMFYRNIGTQLEIGYQWT